MHYCFPCCFPLELHSTTQALSLFLWLQQLLILAMSKPPPVTCTNTFLLTCSQWVVPMLTWDNPNVHGQEQERCTHSSEMLSWCAVTFIVQVSCVLYKPTRAQHAGEGLSSAASNCSPNCFPFWDYINLKSVLGIWTPIFYTISF